ncbi:Uncharacterised protein [Mycobacteroides abscessus subsp. abscessus]|nr:Uncharacterised protein [Mycobacteroides abscessus subsp. abscessus]
MNPTAKKAPIASAKTIVPTPAPMFSCTDLVNTSCSWPCSPVSISSAWLRPSS